MKRVLLILLCLIPVCAICEEKPPTVSDAVTIAQLNKVIELQQLQINRLQAQVNELQGTNAIAQSLTANASVMKAECEKVKGWTLSTQPNGFFNPDKDGKPFCIKTPETPTPSK